MQRMIRSGSKDIKVGEEIQLSCESSGDTKWFHSKTSQLPKNEAISHERILNLRNTTVSQSGYYYCYGEFGNAKYGNVVNFVDSIIIKVFGK